LFVNRAEPGDRIERDAGTVAPLIHAAFARVLDHVVGGHVIFVAERNHPVAAARTAGAGWEIRVRGDAVNLQVRLSQGDLYLRVERLGTGIEVELAQGWSTVLRW